MTKFWNHGSRPPSTASPSIGRGDVVRSVRVPLLYPCRYSREKLSVRESDRRCSPLLPSVLNVFPSVEPTTIVKVCIQFLSFRTKLTFRRNVPCIALHSNMPMVIIFWNRVVPIHNVIPVYEYEYIWHPCCSCSWYNSTAPEPVFHPWGYVIV